MEANLRARTLSETRGFLKALVEAQSDRILGFTAFGVGSRGDHGCRTGCDDRRITLHCASGCCPDPPHTSRGPDTTVLIGTDRDQIVDTSMSAA